ncbi:hypothetical protein BU16DRAFT_500102 [Lophium mytilinum]|uniref:F-box domain-containing protein n=1 Tax=Lophium mytilinum TaxID=390894 RepID=A0A6A6RBQ8_9PEZI|nr:hypothetical protein BU16DRAFT_500102 [Lophium mytilinum]
MGASTTPSTPVSRRGFPVTPKSKSRSPGSTTVSPKSRSPRKSETPISINQARRNFIEHLESWSLYRRANCSFSGKISPREPDYHSKKPYALGEAVICELLPHGETTAVTIVVRLFALPNQFKYRMIIRCGAGWEDERSWFLRQHRKYQARAKKQNRHGPVTSSPRSLASDGFPVTVRPLFNKFTLLPIELQQWIFEFAMGNVDGVRPHLSRQMKEVQRPMVENVSVAKLLTLSRSINCHVTPWFFRTTTFHFATQHLTTFLLQLGPINRSELRKLSVSFGRYSMIHVARFYTPNQVFELFEPPMLPLQHFWRLTLQDCMRELNLAVLTIKVDRMIKRDVSAVAKGLATSFGSVGQVRFENEGRPIEAESYRAGKKFEKTWYQHTQDIFERYCKGRESEHIFGKDQLKGTLEDLEKKMNDDPEFFQT